MGFALKPNPHISPLWRWDLLNPNSTHFFTCSSSLQSGWKNPSLKEARRVVLLMSYVPQPARKGRGLTPSWMVMKDQKGWLCFPLNYMLSALCLTERYFKCFLCNSWVQPASSLISQRAQASSISPVGPSLALYMLLCSQMGSRMSFRNGNTCCFPSFR
jgi:hypothetical protein